MVVCYLDSLTIKYRRLSLWSYGNILCVNIAVLYSLWGHYDDTKVVHRTLKIALKNWNIDIEVVLYMPKIYLHINAKYRHNNK